MTKSPYDIFISYRRDGGFETANLIAEKLRNTGYCVFLDVESLHSGGAVRHSIFSPTLF